MLLKSSYKLWANCESLWVLSCKKFLILWGRVFVGQGGQGRFFNEMRGGQKCYGDFLHLQSGKKCILVWCHICQECEICSPLFFGAPNSLMELGFGLLRHMTPIHHPIFCTSFQVPVIFSFNISYTHPRVLEKFLVKSLVISDFF